MRFYSPGARIAGRYEVAGRPMVGGMGIVYVCLDLEEDRPVALKTFKPEYLPNRAARDRFLREGTHWVELGTHPHIVRCHEVIHPGVGLEVYLVLELVAKEGGRTDASLRSWLTPGVPLPAEMALLFALQAARGMQHAVATIAGFVHRDLKPENLLVGADRLTGETAANRVRVTDLGLVRARDTGEAVSAVGEDEHLLPPPGLDRPGSIVGTPPYMAPEQWDRSDVDLRADIYALGCILGEMLAGQMLVEERTLYSFRQAHQGGQAEEVIGQLPGNVGGVLSRCLAPQPAARYGTWNEVEAALAAAYKAVADRPAPAPELVATLGRGQRITVGWSYNALGVSYLDLGRAADAVPFFERAVETGRAEGNRHLEFAGLDHMGLAYANLGSAERARACHEQALSISREIGDQRGEGGALANLGSAYRRQGDARRAKSLNDEALLIAREVGDRFLEGGALANLGLAHSDLGHIHRAVEFQEQALGISRKVGDQRSECTNLCNLGDAHRRSGDARRAVESCEQALLITREIGDRLKECVALAGLGLAHADLGGTHQARVYHEKALLIAREVGNRREEGNALSNLGSVYLLLDELPSAIDYFEQGLAIDREIGDRSGEGSDLGSLGSAYLSQGNLRSAIGHLEQALAIAREIHDRRGEGIRLGNLGKAYFLLDDTQRAVECYEHALDIAREIGDRKGEAMRCLNLALLYELRGDLARSAELMHYCVDLERTIGHPDASKHAAYLAQLRTRMG
jgi:tetratricopeptide (TPR) repeat protein